MARKATGTVEYRRGKDGAPGKWWARITCQDGSRPWIELQGSWPNTAAGKARAKEAAASYAERFRERGIVAVPQRGAKPIRLSSNAQGETLAQWSERWLESRRKRGLASVSNDTSRLRTHVLPLLGPHPMREIRREQVEELVQRLDARVQAGELSWKTTLNVWAIVTKMFKDAQRSKVTALRVRDDNPCVDVEGPDRGGEKSRTYLFPSEFLELASCRDVPLRWRCMVAVSIYLGPRASELDALQWEDLDLEHGVANIHRALNRSRSGTKTTKTSTPRRIPIEPAALPLLRAMRAESKGDGTVFPLLDLTRRPVKLRMFLRRAGVTRPELFVSSSDKTRKPLEWHDLRATAATWMAVRGDEPLRIMQRLGHKTFSTTMIYVREAEALRTGFGETFPALPDSLLSKTRQDDLGGVNRPTNRLSDSNTAESLSGTRVLNTMTDLGMPESYRVG